MEIALLIRAIKLRNRKKYKSALGIYLSEHENDPQNPLLLAQIGECYSQMAQYNRKETGENYEIALSWMKKAIEIEPENPAFHNSLGYIHWLGVLEYELAANNFRTALKLNPNFVSALSGLAALYGPPESDVKINEAIESMERVVQLDPIDPVYRLHLKFLYREAGRTAEAEQQLVKALLSPKPLDSATIDGLPKDYEKNG